MKDEGRKPARKNEAVPRRLACIDTRRACLSIYSSFPRPPRVLPRAPLVPNPAVMSGDTRAKENRAVIVNCWPWASRVLISHSCKLHGRASVPRSKQEVSDGNLIARARRPALEGVVTFVLVRLPVWGQAGQGNAAVGLPVVHRGERRRFGGGIVRGEVGAQHRRPVIADEVLAVEEILPAIHFSFAARRCGRSGHSNGGWLAR